MRFKLVIISCALMFFISWAGAQGPAAPEQPAGYRPFTILSPLPDSLVPAEEPLEISLLLDETGGLDLRLLLDGIDITLQAQATGDYVFYLSPEPPESGSHRITVLLTSQADTIFTDSWSFGVAPADSAAGPLRMPLDVSLTGGLFYSRCDRDTAGLGLSYPIGWHPSGDINLSGQLAGGLFNSYVSYDPVYDKNIHGLLQYDNSSFGLSLGEFYPELSSLVFSGATPLGVLASWQDQRTGALMAACRTQAADTLFQTYAQYLYGGQVKRSLAEGLWLAGGCLYGYDQPGSLPDSVRFRSSTYVYNDTLTGFSDTLVVVDTLLSGRNRLYWLSIEWPWSGARIRSEYAESGFQPDSAAGFISDHSYLIGIKKTLGRHAVDLQYISWGRRFKTFGNPYLETAKNEFIWAANFRWPGGLSARADGTTYKVFTDSTAGNSFKTGGGLGYQGKRLISASLRLDYNYRPYILYLYQNRSLSLGAVVRLWNFSAISSYSYSSSSGSSLTQSHNGLLGISRHLWDERLNVQLSAQHFQVHDSHGLTSQARTTSELRASWQVSAHVSIISNVRNIVNRDKVYPAKNYVQSLASLSVSYRF